jgi:hypothetical protein
MTPLLDRVCRRAQTAEPPEEAHPEHVEHNDPNPSPHVTNGTPWGEVHAVRECSRMALSGVPICGRLSSRRARGKQSHRGSRVLSIGSVVGGVGAGARAWNEPISELTRRVADARLGVESPLNLNVVFHVPGEVLRISEPYVRTGRYDSRTRHLMVQATVPESLPEQQTASSFPAFRKRLTLPRSGRGVAR